MVYEARDLRTAATTAGRRSRPSAYNAGMGERARRARRWLVGVAIVGFWAAMGAWLVHREVLPTARRARLATAPTEPRERWYGLFAGGGRLGVVHLVERPERRDEVEGATFQVTASVTLAAAGPAGRLQLAGSLWYPLGDGAVELEGSVVSGSHELRVRGTVRNGFLDAVVTSAGEEVPLRTRIDEGLFVAGSSPLGTAVPPLRAGEEAVLPGFDPLTLQRTRVRLRRLPDGERPPGGPPEAVQVLRVHAGSVSLLVWADSEGEILLAETPFGLAVRRLSRAEALTGREGPTPELLAATLIAPHGHRPHRGARRMVVRLAGGSEALPEDDAQLRLRDGVYRIVAHPPLAAAPVAAAPPGFLAAEPLVQSDHPKIRAAAASIVGDAADPWERARLLSRWVHEEVAKKAVMTLPSALDVLASREGDCNEHTVLFTALARAAGVPCRIAVGIVWSEELEAFGYHAWPEVWVGRWVRVDPTFGQEVADATHLKLVEGGVERWGQVLGFIGRLEVEVLEVE